MMTIKEYLESIGISFEEDQCEIDFLSQPEIVNFLLEKFEEHNTILEEETNVNNTMIRFTGEEEPMDEAEKQRAKELAIKNQIQSLNINLQNGKVNQAYSCAIDVDLLTANGIEDFDFEGLDQLGLVYNKETHTIEGTPETAGDYKIACHLKANEISLVKELALVINPDPRSLWNNIPTSEDIIFYKSDSDKKYLRSENKSAEYAKNIVVASQRGRSHAHEGSPRDDDFGAYIDAENGWYISTVADGAGSVQFSRKGAQLACEESLEACKIALKTETKNLEELASDFVQEGSLENKKKVIDLIYPILGGAVLAAYKRIKEMAENTAGSTQRDFSTTLLLTISKKYSFGWFVASFWIGDGCIGIYDKEKQFLKIMGEPDGGEFAGQTCFLTMSEIMQSDEIYRRIRFEIVDDFTALVLMTDGVTDPKFETEANLMKIEKWNAFWGDLTNEVDLRRDFDSSEQLLKWLDFWMPGNHDDRTISILY